MLYHKASLRSSGRLASSGVTAFLIACGLFAPLALAQLTPEELAEKYPPRSEDLRPTMGWAPQFQRQIVAPERDYIPVMVDWGRNTASRSQVTFGIPFPRGALADSNHIRLIDDTGTVIPAGFTTTATWDGPNGPVRWALANAELEKDRTYFIEYGTGVTAVTEPIIVSESAASITINTGPMLATISRTESSIIKSVILGTAGSDVFVDAGEHIDTDQTKVRLPAVTDAAGNIYTANGTDGEFKVEVVENGPQRVVVRREGWYTGSNGEKFCQFITYTYFYSGRTGFRHDHTLVVAFDSNAHQIRDICLPMPLRLDGQAEAVFATDSSADGSPLVLPERGSPYNLIQTNHDSWKLTGRKGSVAEGTRAGGWFALAASNGGAAAGVMDFWQQFPAQLTTDGNTLAVHLWPDRDVEPLCLRPSTQLGSIYPGDLNFHGNWYVDGLDEMTQAYGLGKTHTIHYSFFSAETRNDAWAATRAQTIEPVLALPDPQWICDTDVLYGRVHPVDREKFPKIEGAIDTIVEHYKKAREDKAQYGWIHFGDVFNTGNLWRRWASMFYGFPNVMPRLYLRSGERDKWDFHRVNTKHITDIDICHLTSDAFTTDPSERKVNPAYLNKVKGLRYGGNGGIAHYAADLYDVGPDSHIEFMLMDYYINGNLRTWEVANEYLQAHADRRDARAMTEYRHRGTGGALRLFTQGYQATWNPLYLSIMRQIADVLCKQQAKVGYVRHDDVYMLPGFVMYYQVTGDEAMRDLFLANMSRLSERRETYAESSGGRHATISGLSMAYLFTGDEKYLPFMRWQLEEVTEKGIDAVRGNRLAINATHAYQLPVAMSVLSTVPSLPAAEGPGGVDAVAAPLAIGTNSAIYLLEKEDGPFTISLGLNLYRAVSGDFYNWNEWIEALPQDEQPAILVLDPDGNEILRRELTTADHNTQLKFTVKADGKTGTYTIVPTTTPAPLSIALHSTSLDQRVFHVEAGNQTVRTNSRTKPSYFFLVPAGTQKFSIAMKTEQTRSSTHCMIRNQDGDVIWEGRWEADSQPHNEWEITELDADSPGEDEIWSMAFDVHPNMPVYLDFTGIPGYVASSPEELFYPDPARRSEIPAPVRPGAKSDTATVVEDAGLPWNGAAVYLNSPFKIEAKGDKPLINEERGTIELWVRTLDQPATLADKSILNCGGLSLQRRYTIGTYAGIANQRFHRFFILPNNRWTHLALTWQPAPDNKDGAVELRLFADGVEVKDGRFLDANSPIKSVNPGWSDNRVSVSANIMVSNLRVSDTVRYEANFPRPTAPFTADDNTRLLIPFDSTK